MKTKLLMLLLLINGLTFGQTINQTIEPKLIKFYYDIAGNQTERKVVCINCARLSTSLTNEDFIVDEKISYYPNPVKEELFINWKNKENEVVKYLEVYNLNGQLLHNINDLKNTETASVHFQSYPEGIYLVNINFENGTQQTLKIVKK